MATYSVSVAKHQTLGVATVDDVSFNVYGKYLQVLHRGSATNPIYFTVGGSAATTATPSSTGDNVYVVTAGAPITVAWPFTAGTTACVKLISAGAEPYSVQVINDRLS